MYHQPSISLLNLLLSMSDAMDLASSDLSQHQLRTAFVAWELGKVAKLPPTTMNDLFAAAVLHDIGALSLEEKISIHEGECSHPDLHCVIGERVLKAIPMFELSAKIVRLHHTAWHSLDGQHGEPVVFLSQFLQLADILERSIDRRKYILHQHHELTRRIRELSGTVLSSDVVEYFESVAVREDFWLDLVSSRLYSLLIRHGPNHDAKIDLDLLTQISRMFRVIIDFRSSFTATHSSGVATSAREISRLMGLTDTECGMMEVAGNLHDLGKLVIPNSILNKAGPLDAGETALMRQHTYFTYSVLNSIGGIQQIAEWAAFHHERLDGSGYPFHVGADKLSIGSRIMAIADVFTALAEDRPYRPAMTREKTISIMNNMRDAKCLDRIALSVLESNFDEIHAVVQQRQAEARASYDQEYCHFS